MITNQIKLGKNTNLFLRGEIAELEHIQSSRPSWKNSGDGFSSIKLSAFTKWDAIEIVASETALGAKRDVTKQVFSRVPLSAVVELLKSVGYSVTKN